MKMIYSLARVAVVLAAALLLPQPVSAADHNDPNSINSIFYDLQPSPADLYDLFGWPSDEPGEERVIVALTFGAVPAAGKLDPDLLYRINISPSPRTSPNLQEDTSLEVMLKYLDSVKNKYLNLHPGEIRVTVDATGQASLSFARFPGGDFSKLIATNQEVSVTAPDGSSIKVFVGGRDDAFFNDLPGFFRSINYAPQFYKVEHTKPKLRELSIPKTLLELEGNRLFNFDPGNPQFGHDPRTKIDLPNESLSLSGRKFFKDQNGNFRFVYSGVDAQAGKNVNAIILELPTKYLTKAPEKDRVINAWGESWVRKAADKVDTIPDDRPALPGPFWFRHPWLLPLLIVILGLVFLYFGLRMWVRKVRGPEPAPTRGKLILGSIGSVGGLLAVILGLYAGAILAGVAKQKPALTLDPEQLDEQLRKYKLVDTDGLPFADAALNLREDNRQLGADNFWLGPHLVLRLAHLGWGFGPSVDALGLKTSFDHGGSPVSVDKEYSYAGILDAFLRGRKVVFQKLNMPDNSWNKKGLDIPLRRPIEIFIPNVCAIDMDTTGTWPFGRRLEDQVATRFLSLFLDMTSKVGGKPVHVDTLGDPALWQSAPVEPKTPPNPLKNDKPFLTKFPYLAEPWPENYHPGEPPPSYTPPTPP